MSDELTGLSDDGLDDDEFTYLEADHIDLARHHISLADAAIDRLAAATLKVHLAAAQVHALVSIAENLENLAVAADLRWYPTDLDEDDEEPLAEWEKELIAEAKADEAPQ